MSLAELRYNVTMFLSSTSFGNLIITIDILLRFSLQLLRITECQWPPK